MLSGYGVEMMDSFALLLTLALTFALGIASARKLLDGVLYLMARNTMSAPRPQGVPVSGEPAQS